jgi:two-component system, NarL family, response regulator YdfI
MGKSPSDFFNGSIIRSLNRSIRNAGMIRVLVAANSAVELAGLASLIKSAPSLQLVGSTLGGAALEEQIEALRPDVVLQQPVAGDEEWHLSSQDSDAPARVLLVGESQFAGALTAAHTIDSGVRAVLPRFATADEILTAVGAAAMGLVVLHPAVLEHLPAALRPDLRDPPNPPLQSLSPRETEVLNMLADGLGNKEIAWRLRISEHTVKFHIGSIFNKLNASSRAEAVAIGVRRGLIAL